MVRKIARILIAGIFIVGGIDSVRNPRSKAEAADRGGQPVASKAGVDLSSPQLVTLNGVAQIAGGFMMVMGWLPRIASLLLGASLVPTTAGAHPFWEIDEPEERRAQMIQALKNASILGGLLFVSLDQGGRPSVFWSTRKAAEAAVESVGRAVDRVA